MTEDEREIVRDAYFEAVEAEADRNFLFGMRYVMGLLEMPEGRVPASRLVRVEDDD